MHPQLVAPVVPPDTLEGRFQSHDVNELGQQQMQEIRDRYMLLALALENLLPDGREKSLALTDLEKSSMMAVASIARRYPIRGRS